MENSKPKRLLTNREFDELVKLDEKKQKKYLEKIKEELWEQLVQTEQKKN